jgi:hypothetical protein
MVKAPITLLYLIVLTIQVLLSATSTNYKPYVVEANNYQEVSDVQTGRREGTAQGFNSV